MGDYNKNPEIEEIFAGMRSEISGVKRSLVSPAPWHAPALLNGFANVGGSEAPAGYYIDGQGRVFLRGRIDAPTDTFTDALLFTLDAGFRPAYVHTFPVVASADPEFGPIWCAVTAYPNGQVLVSGSQIETFPLDPVSFRIS